MALFYYLVAIILILCLLYSLMYIRAHRSPLINLPGPRVNLLLGTLENLLNKDFRYFSFFQHLRKIHGPIRRTPLPLGRIGMDISDPEWVKYVLITSGSNFYNGEFMGSGFFKQAVGDNGLVVVNGETHKKYKKILSPAYKLSTLKKSMFIVQLCGDRMVNLFRDSCSKDKVISGDFMGATEIDVKYLFNKTTIDIAVLFLLGYDLQESSSWEVDTFGHLLWKVLEMQEYLFAVLSMFYVRSSMLRALRKMCRYLPNGGIWTTRTTNKMHDMIENIIESKVVEYHQNHGSEETNESKGSFKPLLNYMLDINTHGINLSRQEIHDLVMTFIIGGHETASISLMFTLYELCKKPEYQTRLREEVIKGFKENDNVIDWDDITKKFPFLNAVVKESLRMYPPVPWLPRITVKEDMVDGHYLPPNTMVTVMTSELMRSPDIWPDPDEFKPERFLEPDDTIPWDCWLPFGEGFHKCIGYQFGLIEVTYLLAMAIKNFRFALDPKAEHHEHVFVSLNVKPTLNLYVTPL